MRLFALIALLLAGCNALTGVNDYTTPGCEDCLRKACTQELTTCIDDEVCGPIFGCVQGCFMTSAGPPCIQACSMLDGAHSAKATAFESCGTVNCSVCGFRGGDAGATE